MNATESRKFSGFKTKEKHEAFIAEFKERQRQSTLDTIERWKQRIDRYRARGWDDLADAEQACLDEYNGNSK